jgi:hypothetical protein
MATKAEQATELFKQNAGISNNDFIQMLMDKLGMTKLGARTYCYNVRKQAGVEVPQRGAAKKATKAEKPAKAEKAPKKEKVEKAPKAKKATSKPATETEVAAREKHKSSFLSFVPWDELSDESRAEFIANEGEAAQ